MHSSSKLHSDAQVAFAVVWLSYTHRVPGQHALAAEVHERAAGMQLPEQYCSGAHTLALLSSSGAQQPLAQSLSRPHIGVQTALGAPVAETHSDPRQHPSGSELQMV
jgi:hypothetical protein